MRKNMVSKVAITLMLIAWIIQPIPSQAGGKIEIDETKWISVGAGLRTSFVAREDAAGRDSDDYSKDFEVESFRLYLNGQVHEMITLEINTEVKSTGDPADESLRFMDVISKFEFHEMFNVWLGRMLPPNDRANMDGPFYLATWHFPGVAQRTPNAAVGRDDGVTIWGRTSNDDGPNFLYGLGAFQGLDNDIINPDDNLFYVGKLSVNLWDPEPAPWYYTGSTYLGGADILAISAVAQFQSDGAGSEGTPATATDPGTPTTRGDFTNWSIDVLLEKDLDVGVLTLEGMYFDYDLDDVMSDDRGFVQQGESVVGQISWLFPDEIGPGKVQPHYRFQQFDADATGTLERHDFGVNYYFDGPNAKAYLGYAIVDPDGGDDAGEITLGVQLQI